MAPCDLEDAWRRQILDTYSKTTNPDQGGHVRFRLEVAKMTSSLSIASSEDEASVSYVKLTVGHHYKEYQRCLCTQRMLHYLAGQMPRHPQYCLRNGQMILPRIKPSRILRVRRRLSRIYHQTSAGDSHLPLSFHGIPEYSSLGLTCSLRRSSPGPSCQYLCMLWLMTRLKLCFLPQLRATSTMETAFK
jgi:hypothetical protein